MDKKNDRYETAVRAAERLMSSRQKAEYWLQHYVRGLDAKPIDLLGNDEGLEAVLTLIGRLEHGIVN